MTKIICITGPDGSGKSTLINNLLREFPGYIEASVWDLMTSSQAVLPFKSKLEVDQYLCQLGNPSRMMFLAHALSYSMESAMQKNPEGIFLNAYLYKYFTSELALGNYPELVENITDHFPKPHQVIYLDISPEVAASRKTYFSRYECGLSKTPDRESFISFQNKAAEKWKIFDQSKWNVISALQNPNQLIEQTKKLLNQK